MDKNSNWHNLPGMSMGLWRDQVKNMKLGYDSRIMVFNREPA